MTAGVVARVHYSRQLVLSQSRGTGDRPASGSLISGNTVRVRSGPMRAFSFPVPDWTTAAQGFRKLRLLEVVLPCRFDFYSPGP